jgi:hypothetical protein
MSDQIVGLKSVDSQICRTFWEEYVRPESMIVDTLGVYCRGLSQHIIIDQLPTNFQFSCVFLSICMIIWKNQFWVQSAIDISGNTSLKNMS